MKNLTESNRKKKLIMKKYLYLAALVLAAACAKETPAPTNVTGEVSFVCSIDQTKISADKGKSSFDALDQISVFSVDNSGSIVSGNVAYKTTAGGATASFGFDDTTPLTPSDKYYAYFPISKQYPNNTTADEGTGFPGATAGDPVTDYRYMPITVNSTATVVIDPATGKTVSNNSVKHYYATGLAPANADDPVALQFKPVLPLLEFSIYGSGTVKSVKIELADKTDGNKADNTWMSAKGIFDMSTGTLTTTNFSNSAYPAITVSLSDGTNGYVTLDDTTPINFQITTGRFHAVHGLKLTFKDKDDNECVKNIWASRDVNMFEGGVCKHIHQPLDVYLSGYSSKVNTADVDWSKSYIHYIKGYGGTIVGAITKEYLGCGVDKQAIVAYPANAGVVDYTNGTVLEVTLDAGAAPAGNIHGGTVNAYTMDNTAVAYTAGSSAAISTFYVKDGAIYLTKPVGGEFNATIDPYILTSLSNIDHKLVKIGNKVWTAEGYKTLIKNNTQAYGTVFEISSASPAAYGAVAYDNTAGIYLYSGGACSFANNDAAAYTSRLAPSGWDLPSMAEWKTDLNGWLGGVASAYGNMTVCLLFDRTCYKYTGSTTGALSNLGYYSTWSKESAGSGKKAQMLLSKSGAALANSAQSISVLFEARILKTLE